jgi:hypothetical protein
MQLQRHVGPHLEWSILLEIGFLGWIGVTVGLIWYVVDEAGNFARRQGWLWGSLMAVFFALWLIGQMIRKPGIPHKKRHRLSLGR